MAGRPATGNAGKGRQKGSKNKSTVAFKEAVMHAADKLGGGQRLFEWTQESKANEKAFWTVIYPKLAPLTVAGDPTAPITFKTVFEARSD